jgi:segregation and condensation protein B
MILDNIQIIEALLFASNTPLTATKIKSILDKISIAEVKNLITELNEKYANGNSPLQIIEIAEGYQIATRKEYASWIDQLYQSRSTHRLTKQALETLAIIAYKQPITKVEVENIRGVNSDTVTRTLIERNLITVVGREKAPGTPLLYGTTKFFMEYFGLADLDHLPKLKEIDELLKDDEKFLESIDQVALEQIHPEVLGISTVQEVENPTQPQSGEETDKHSPKNASLESENKENPVEDDPTE